MPSMQQLLQLRQIRKWLLAVSFSSYQDQITVTAAVAIEKMAAAMAAVD